MEERGVVREMNDWNELNVVFGTCKNSTVLCRNEESQTQNISSKSCLSQLIKDQTSSWYVNVERTSIELVDACLVQLCCFVYQCTVFISCRTLGILWNLKGIADIKVLGRCSS